MLNFLKNLPYTFYSADFYRNLVTNGKGVGIAFILVVAFLHTMNIAPKIITKLDGLSEEQKTLLSTLPEMTLYNEELSIQGNSLQIFTMNKDAEEGPFQIVFDMNAKTPTDQELKETMRNERTIVWVNKEGVFSYNPIDDQLTNRTFAGHPDGSITRENWISISESVETLIGPTLLLSTFVASFVTQLFYALVVGVFVWIGAFFLKRKMPYQTAARLAAASSIPVGVVYLFIAPAIPIQAAFWFGFALFALLSIKPAQTQKG